MSIHDYWSDVFTATTWREFLDAGANVTGFSEERWKKVQEFKIGDYLLCYMTSASRLMGILEVTSNPFKDNTQIWEDKIYPCRVRVKAIIAHPTSETAIPIKLLEGQLSIFNSERPKAWGGFFRGSPRKWKASDGEIIVNALLEAQRDPTVYPFT